MRVLCKLTQFRHRSFYTYSHSALHKYKEKNKKQITHSNVYYRVHVLKALKSHCKHTITVHCTPCTFQLPVQLPSHSEAELNRQKLTIRSYSVSSQVPNRCSTCRDIAQQLTIPSALQKKKIKFQ